MSFESPQQYNPEDDKQSREVFDMKEVGEGTFEFIKEPNLKATISNTNREYFIKVTHEIAEAFNLTLSINEKTGVFYSTFEIRVQGAREDILNFEKSMRDFGR